MSRSTLAAHASRALMSSGYNGARTDRRALAEYLASIGSADSDSLSDLPTLRARSRDLVRNNPLAGGAINTNVTSTIGRGLRVQPKINRQMLGLSEEEADAWERQAQALFQLCAPQLDITRTQTFGGLQDLAFRSPLESGDLFVLRRYRKGPGDVLGLKIQLIEADRVSNPLGVWDSAQLKSGVEMDADGAPVRYHVADRHPGDFLSVGVTRWAAVPAFGAKSGERQTLHLFKKRRPGQTRGVPYLAPVIEQFKQLDRYSEAELMAAVINAMFTVFIKTQADEDDVGAIAPAVGDGETAADVAESGEFKLGNGTMLNLAPGEDVEIAATNRPNPNFDPFVMAVVRQIGVGLELPHEVLIKHFTASYSAARAALLEAWRYFMVSREWVAGSFCQPVYEWTISEAVSRGLLDAPGFFTDPLLRRAWLGAAWIGDAPGQLDPKKEADAGAIRVREGFSTLEMEVASLSGANWEDVHEQRAKEARMRREAGMEPELPPPAAPVGEPGPGAPLREQQTNHHRR